MSSSLERLARNQTLFREIKERVKEVAEPSELIRFICECSHVGCEATVELGRAEYESLRSEASHFVVASGHSLPELERVVASYDGYLIVEKVNGREAAKATDTRAAA